MTDRYTYRVSWSPEDEEYVGLCFEFPSLSWLAPSLDEAFSGIRQVVSECVDDMKAANETPPEAITEIGHSGDFIIVRVTPETHRALTTQADEAGISVNRLVSAHLSNTPT